MGLFATAYASGSVFLGKTTIGAGIVLETIEPVRFWQLVKLQFAAGAVLLVLSVFAGRTSR